MGNRNGGAGWATAALLGGLVLTAAAAAAFAHHTPAGSPGEAPPAGSGPGPGTAGEQLLAAAGRGDVGVVQALVAAGADREATDSAGRTPLVVASYNHDLPVARALIEAGADVNHQDGTKQSAYLIATSEIGPDQGLELLRLTLAHGADVTALDRFNGTGLIRAAHRGYPDIVGELVRAGTAIDHVNGLGWTALLEAVILGDGGPRHTQVVERLLTAGADPNLADRDGVTPLAHARARDQPTVVGLLTAAGARG